jgi:8-oxo-dGTP pyrophosphatase MutT (NUDIX family)
MYYNRHMSSPFQSLSHRYALPSDDMWTQKEEKKGCGKFTWNSKRDDVMVMGVKETKVLRNAVNVATANIYGGIIYCRSTSRYVLVQGRSSGKWSFPKGHKNGAEESPMDCVSREVGEEIGCDVLPSPSKAVPLHVGYYYLFEVDDEFELKPRDVNEVGSCGWFNVDELAKLNLNVDANKYYRECLRKGEDEVSYTTHLTKIKKS